MRQRESLLPDRPDRPREDRQAPHQRLGEMPTLVAEIVPQALKQMRLVSERGPARKAVRAAAKLSAQVNPQSATIRLSELLRARKLVDAAALSVHAAEEFPGEAAAELACRAGAACRDASETDLAILSFTSAVLAAPPCEPACRQLADLFLEWARPRQGPSRAQLYAPARIDLEEEERDPRLALIWLEFLARALRVQGADGEAVAVYQRLLTMAPGREDLRSVLRQAATTGRLPD